MFVKPLYLTTMLVACFNIVACGDNKGNNHAPNLSSTVAMFQTHDFTATVEQITGTPPFTVAIGDKLHGRIVYELNANDWNVNDLNQGWFHHMSSPSRFEFQVGDLKYISSGSEYFIGIENDDASVQPVRDIFGIYSKSDQDTYMRSDFVLRDFKASTFSTSTCNTLPRLLNINDFSNNYMSITYNTPGGWTIGLTPDSLTTQP